MTLLTTRQLLIDHQLATDCTDGQMVEILCSFLESLDDQGELSHTWSERLGEFVASQLERGPTLPTIADERFTHADRIKIKREAERQVFDCQLEIAQDLIGESDMLTLISWASKDPELLANILMSMRIELGPKVNGDFLRAHDDDGDEYALHLDFAKRMGLIDEAEENVTPLGVEFMQRYS